MLAAMNSSIRLDKRELILAKGSQVMTRRGYHGTGVMEIVQAADVVVTMGCGDACPFYPGTRYEDWDLEDPAGQGVEAVRPIRDEIRRLLDQKDDVADAKQQSDKVEKGKKGAASPEEA